MRVLVLLVVVLLVALVALVIYTARLRRTIRESDNPLLALPRKQRARIIQSRYDLELQKNYDTTIQNWSIAQPRNRKDS